MGSHLITAVLAATPSPSSTGGAAGDGGFNWFNIIFLVVIAALIFFMWRNSRKRRADQPAMQSRFVPGVEIMTNFGLFGRIVSIDEAENRVVIETSPGNTVTVHRQVITRVVEPPAEAPEAESIAETDAGEPQYGERVDPDKKSDE